MSRLSRPAGSGLVNRNVFSGDDRTSMRHSGAMWDAVRAICERERMTLAAVIREAEAAYPGEGRSCAVRSYAVTYWREAAECRS